MAIMSVSRALSEKDIEKNGYPKLTIEEMLPDGREAWQMSIVPVAASATSAEGITPSFQC